MPWSTTNTIASMQNKPLEQRKLFAEVANKQLEDGKSEDSAIIAGLAAVKNKFKQYKFNNVELSSSLLDKCFYWSSYCSIS